MQLSAQYESGERPFYWYTCRICKETRHWKNRCVSEYCGGNVARFEKSKIKYGVRVRYTGVAPSIRRSLSHAFVEILTGLYRRVPKPSKALREWAVHIEQGYCLDAPNVMPAGGCFDDVLDMAELGEKGISHMPSQIVITRE